jgi:peptidoglycan/LPS O-acetylase OafA/YrhL
LNKERNVIGGSTHVDAGLGYNPALDGARAIAVLGVIAGHAGLQIAGYQGVTLFFVISGYLITGLLVDEFQATGHIGIRRFYRRRFARLGPALLMSTLAALVYILAVGQSPAGAWRGLLGALTYTTDLVLAVFGAHKVGIFEPTWSLGIEEQFYLIWPAVLLAGLRQQGSPRRLIKIMMGIVVAAWCDRALLWHVGSSHARLFYAPDTHIDALAIGALIAMMLEERRFKPRDIRLVRVAGAIGVLGLGLIIAEHDPFGRVLAFDDGLYGQAAICSGLIVLLLVLGQSSWLGRVLSNRVLVHVGKLSYGLYLWNLLTIEILEHFTRRLPVSTAWGFVWAVGVLLLAELSYHLVEQPLRRRWARPAPRAVQATLDLTDLRAGSSAATVRHFASIE